jgi:hydrogenase nickel incorporation protein HypB
MCDVCGCGKGEARVEGEPIAEEVRDDGRHAHWHRHADGAWHAHEHEHDDAHDQGNGDESATGTSMSRGPRLDPIAESATGTSMSRGPRLGPIADHGHTHDHETGEAGAMHFGQGPAHAHVPGMSQARMVQIERDILAANDRYAQGNRRYFVERGIFALNLVSSPGAGKTTLLLRTIERLRGSVPVAVIEGDQQTSLDADRIRATGAPALQVNTGKGCHLDAHMIAHALERLAPPEQGVLLIENVGNLVCPASFDLGEAHKVVVLSVTEGDDKPLKYPDMFHAADLMLLNKTDLLPHVDFDVARCLENARRVNPRLEALQVSARTGEGMDAWIGWLMGGSERTRAAQVGMVERLKTRVAELESLLEAKSTPASA